MRARRRYHRILGLLLALPFLWLCVTGVVLNHSTELKLDQRMISSPALLRFYLEFPPEEQGHSFEAGSRTVSQWGEQVFLDEAILPIQEPLIGAIPLGPYLLIATPERLYLFGENLELMDSVDDASLPATPIQGIASQPTPILRAGDQHFALDADLLDFPAVESVDSQFPPPQPLSDTLRDELRQTLAAHMPVSYYRVLLDLHKFSFLGGFGKWVLTFSTLGLIILGITGLMLFRKRKPATSQAG